MEKDDLETKGIYINNLDVGDTGEKCMSNKKSQMKSDMDIKGFLTHS